MNVQYSHDELRWKQITKQENNQICDVITVTSLVWNEYIQWRDNRHGIQPSILSKSARNNLQSLGILVDSVLDKCDTT